jgi:N-methylhydantoinase B
VDLIRQQVPAGTTAIVVTAGGGGWGDPLERMIDLVRGDVIAGLVSIEAARDRYGVVFAPGTFDVDVNATTALRAELSRHRGTGKA